MANIGRLWLLSLFLLAGCASVKDWDEYERYQSGKDFSRQEYENRLLAQKIGKVKKKKAREDLYEKELKEKTVQLLREPPSPVKVPDTVLRVLILPYVTSDGSLSTAKYVFLKVDEGKWILGDYLLDRKKGIKLLTPLEEKKKDE